MTQTCAWSLRFSKTQATRGGCCNYPPVYLLGRISHDSDMSSGDSASAGILVSK